MCIVNLSPKLTVLNLNYSLTFDSTELVEFLTDVNHSCLGALKIQHHFNERCFNGKKWLRGFSNLKNLDINNCSIESITFGDHMSGLESMCLSDNPLVKLDESLNRLVNLKKLDLSKTFVKLVPDMFSTQNKLEYLNLESVWGNEWEKMDKNVFRGLINLKSLRLESNHITYLNHDLFANMPKLARLDLEGNCLKLESNTFIYLQELKYLNLSHNNLKSLPNEVFSSLGCLEELELAYNYLIFDKNTFDGLENLRKLNLYKNTTLCFFYKEFINSLSNHKHLETIIFEKLDYLKKEFQQELR